MTTTNRISLFLLLIANIFCNRVFSQSQDNNCYIKINMMDCQSCLTSLKFIEYIDKNVKIDYIFKSEYISDIIELRELYITDSTQQRIQFSDSIYSLLNKRIPSTSVAILNDENVIVEEFPLRSIRNYVNIINMPDTFSFKDKLPVSFLSKIQSNSLYIFDKPKNEIISAKLNKKVAAATKFKLTASIIKRAYNAHFNDTLSYYLIDTFIKRMRVPPFIKMNQISSFDVKNDTLFVLIETLYPKPCIYNNKEDTCFFIFYSLLSVRGNKVFEVKAVRNKVEDTTLIYTTDDYAISGSQINILDTGLLINISRKIKSKDNYFLGYWKLSNNEYQFSEPLPIDLPKLVYQYGIGYNLNDYILKYPYLIYKFSDEVIDLRNNVRNRIKLEKLGNIVETNGMSDVPKSVAFKIIDFVDDNNGFKLLYSLKGKVILSKYSRDYKVLSSQVLYTYSQNEILFRCDPFFETSDYIVLFPSGSHSMVKQKIQ